ncbi:MAG: sulfite exporter TauE/SafE family protein [Rhodopila sp.]|nr:sulfite exporter TauE/SafE family protein [Rhodopila sp.]
MMEHFQWLGAFCASDTALQGGLLFGMFAAGAAGSVVHCGPMCGVFVLGQMSERMARLPTERLCEWQRMGNGLLLPYHLGRLTTYAGLGALAAGSAAVLGQVAWLGGLSAVLLVVAALLFLMHALARILPSGSRFDRAPRFWSKMIGGFTRRIRRGSVFGEYLLGVALGFLPCGFLYAAIAAAAASANPALGAAAMLAFGMGTTPSLMVIGVAGHAAGRRWSRGVTRAAPVLMALNAMLLLALAWQRLT